MKKRLSLLMVLMMVLSLVPMSVFATAGTAQGGVFSIDDTDEKANKDVSVKLTQAAGVKLTTGSQAVLTLNTGKFGTIDANTGVDTGVTMDVNYEGAKVGEIVRLEGAKEKAYLTMLNTFPASLNAKIDANGRLTEDVDLVSNLKVYFKDSPSVGDVTLSVEEVNDSKIDVSKPIVIGVVKEGTGDNMKVVVKDTTTKIGFDGGELSQITIKDIHKNTGVKAVKLELPDTLSWVNSGTDRTTVVIGSQEVLPANYTVSGTDNNILEFNITSAQLAAKNEIIVKPYVKVDKRNASKGDVSVKVMAMDQTVGTTSPSPKKIETVTVTGGQITDFNITIKAWEKGKKEIPAMYGGDDAIVKVKMTGVKGSFTDNRTIDFTVKGADVTFNTIKGFKNLDTLSEKPDGTKGIVKDGEFSVDVNGTDKDELELEFEIKADWAQNGAVTLIADSRDFGKMETEIAKVTPAYTVETKVTSIKKGESLATADIVIKEAKAGLLDSDKFLVLNLNDRSRGTLTFASDYKVEATNGMKVEDGLYADDGSTRRDLESLSLQVKTSSSKEAAAITISNVIVKVDGSAVDGDKMIETYIVDKDDLGPVKDKSTAVIYALSSAADLTPDFKVPYVTVVKEYGAVATTTVFKIGSKEYTANGETKTANEAPFISGKGYTMLPVKAVAEALGLTSNWNSATKTASFANAEKVASVVIGADTMYVNGTPFKLAAKAEVKNGSTFVELRSLASAFGVKLEWDAATKSVTIKG